MNQSHIDPEQLSQFIEGDLPEADSTRVEQHLQRCDQCRCQLEGLRRMLITLGRMPDLAPPAGFLGRLEERLERRPGFLVRISNILTFGFLPMPARAAALIACIFLVAGLLWQYGVTLQESQLPTIASGYEMKTLEAPPSLKTESDMIRGYPSQRSAGEAPAAALRSRSAQMPQSAPAAPLDSSMIDERRREPIQEQVLERLQALGYMNAGDQFTETSRLVRLGAIGVEETESTTTTEGLLYDETAALESQVIASAEPLKDEETLVDADSPLQAAGRTMGAFSSSGERVQQVTLQSENPKEMLNSLKQWAIRQGWRYEGDEYMPQQGKAQLALHVPADRIDQATQSLQAGDFIIAHSRREAASSPRVHDEKMGVQRMPAFTAPEEGLSTVYFGRQETPADFQTILVIIRQEHPGHMNE